MSEKLTGQELRNRARLFLQELDGYRMEGTPFKDMCKVGSVMAQRDALLAALRAIAQSGDLRTAKDIARTAIADNAE